MLFRSINNYESCFEINNTYFKKDLQNFIFYSRVAQIKDNYFVTSFSTSYSVGINSFVHTSSNFFNYSKVYDIDKGDMVFEVPTNNLEIFDEKKYEVKAPDTTNDKTTIPIILTSAHYLRIGQNTAINQVKDKVAVYNGNLYYLDTNYNNKELNGKQLLDIHEVTFGTSYPNQYRDINLTQEDIELDNKGDTTTARNIYKIYAEVSLNGES